MVDTAKVLILAFLLSMSVVQAEPVKLFVPLVSNPEKGSMEVFWEASPSYADSPCDVVKVLDGDTVDVLVRVTYWHTEAWRVRLVGIDAPEMRTREGPLAKEHLAALIVAAKKLRISVKVSDRNEVVRDKFGRILAELRDAAEAVSLNERMVKDGFAREYHGERRESP